MNIFDEFDIFQCYHHHDSLSARRKKMYSRVRALFIEQPGCYSNRQKQRQIQINTKTKTKRKKCIPDRVHYSLSTIKAARLYITVTEAVSISKDKDK